MVRARGGEGVAVLVWRGGEGQDRGGGGGGRDRLGHEKLPAIKSYGRL